MDPYLKDPKKRVLFEQLEQLIKAQEESIATIRASEKEVCPLNNNSNPMQITFATLLRLSIVLGPQKISAPLIMQ